ncbi:MAG: HNH endonuclease [Planctomycetaceae bacterium]|nr:HNH endonuclease [Planctomycetaceae bacterium]
MSNSHANLDALLAEWVAGMSLDTIEKTHHVSDVPLRKYAKAKLGDDEYKRLCRQHQSKAWFEDGHPTYNTQAPPTAYKRGVLSGNARKTVQPVGTIMVRYYDRRRKIKGGRPCKHLMGRRYIKIGAIRNGGERNWMPMSQYNWEREHGPVPEGKSLYFRDGNTMHDDCENLMLLTHAEWLAWLREHRPEIDKKRLAAMRRALQENAEIRRRIKAAKAETRRWLRMQSRLEENDDFGMEAA